MASPKRELFSGADYETRICSLHPAMLPLIRAKWSQVTCRAIAMHAQKALYESGACKLTAVGVAINASGGPAGPPVSTIAHDPVAILFIVDPYNAQCKQVTAIRTSATAGDNIDKEKTFEVLYKMDFSPSIHQVSGQKHEDGQASRVLIRNPDIEMEDADSDSDEGGDTSHEVRERRQAMEAANIRPSPLPSFGMYH